MNSILFDLDGTLTDSQEGILNSLRYMFDRLHREPPCREELLSFIGPPLEERLAEYFGWPPAEAADAVGIFREYFSSRGIFENQLYPGIYGLLERLSGSGKRLYLATSKPEVSARRVLEHFQLDGFFAGVKGSLLQDNHLSKGDIIAWLVREYSIDTQKACMVGDREFDMIGASQNGISAVGVLYGYGPQEELEAAGADYLVDSVAQLEELLLDTP